MNKLDRKRQAQVVAALVEGASVNSVVRMTGVSKPTILKLLADLGTACAKYQDEKLRSRRMAILAIFRVVNLRQYPAIYLFLLPVYQFLCPCL
jgi:hypothetical protein